ncbi:MAG: PEP-CTERM sorting domain-containing protein [Planctomycetes bacterium]|nr:PEP-CTERM sorting domain-containing protein [Planctomycetota bacterium]
MSTQLTSALFDGFVADDTNFFLHFHFQTFDLDGGRLAITQYPSDDVIPEPTTLALLGLGALAAYVGLPA